MRRGGRGTVSRQPAEEVEIGGTPSIRYCPRLTCVEHGAPDFAGVDPGMIRADGADVRTRARSVPPWGRSQSRCRLIRRGMDTPAGVLRLVPCTPPCLAHGPQVDKHPKRQGDGRSVRADIFTARRPVQARQNRRGGCNSLSRNKPMSRRVMCGRGPRRFWRTTASRGSLAQPSRPSLSFVAPQTALTACQSQTRQAPPLPDRFTGQPKRPSRLPSSRSLDATPGRARSRILSKSVEPSGYPLRLGLPERPSDRC